MKQLKRTDSSRDWMFGRLCSNPLADRPYHFAMMSAIGAVSCDQVRWMWLNNERHHLMHARAVMMAAAVVDAATIVHSYEHPFEYFRCCCYDYYRLLYYLKFDLTTMVRAVVVVAIAKYS